MAKYLFSVLRNFIETRETFGTVNFIAQKKFSLTRKLLFLLVVLPFGNSLYAQMVGDNIFLPGHFIEVGIAPNGSFGSTVDAPSTYYSNAPHVSVFDPGIKCTDSVLTFPLGITCDAAMDGWTVGFPPYFGDYVLPGYPQEGWAIEIGGVDNAYHPNYSTSCDGFSGGSLTGSNISYSNSGGVLSALWQGTDGSLSISQTTTIDTSAMWVIIKVILKNTGDTALNNIYYMRECDPDNDQTYSGTYVTNNTISYQKTTSNRVEVDATGTEYSQAFLGMATRDCRAEAFICTSGLVPTGTLDQIYNQTAATAYYALGTSYTADVGIGLVYNIGTITAGDSTTVVFAYLLKSGTIDSAYASGGLTAGGSEPIANITGDTLICEGTTDLLSDVTVGGVWSSANTRIATVDSTGAVSGVSKGKDTIKYTVTAFCGTSVATFVVTVDSAPKAPSAITGVSTAALCKGKMDTLKDATTGGVWSISNPGIASISSKGVVTAGYDTASATDTVIYTVTNECGSAVATAIVKIGATTATITGSINICKGTTDTLKDVTSGGVWSSSNKNATVSSSGVVTGVSLGKDTIKYSKTIATCAATSVLVVSINAFPSVSVSGSLCAGNTVTVVSSLFSDSIVWKKTGDSTSLTRLSMPDSAGITVAGVSGYAGSDSGHLYYPYDVYLDGAGNIYVADYYNNRVQKWAPGSSVGSTVAGFGGYGSGANQLAYPTGVFVDGSGNVYVADANNERIQKWAPGADSGITVAGTTGISGSSASEFYNPTGVFVDGSGNVFVADEYNSRIQEWTPGATAGITVAGFGGYGNSPSQLADPRGIFVDGSGNMYIADFENSRIQEWAPGATSGTTVAGMGGFGSSPSELDYPMNVYVDGSGNIYVADYDNSRIQEWAPGATAGITVGATDGYGGSATQLGYATGVYVDSKGDIYVSDLYNDRIQEYKDTIVKTYTTGTGGSYTVSVTASDGCRTIDTFKVTSVPAIKGAASVCVGSTTTLSDSATGGSWSSSNTSIATVSSKGVVTGLSAGTDTIKYTVTLSCGTAATTFVIKVGAIIAPVTGSINICKGATDTLRDTTSGGAWSSSNKNATVSSSGVVTGITVGTDTIKYSKTVGKCIAVSVAVVSINAIPSISVSGSLCSGDTIALVSTLTSDSIVWKKTGDSSMVTSRLAPDSAGITVAGISGISGSDSSHLYYPFAVYVDGSGNVYVADEDNYRVQKWAPGASVGTTVAGMGGYGSGATQLEYVTGVYVDGSGNVYVADEDNYRVQKWAPGADSGITVAGVTGVYGSTAGLLSYPAGVFVDGSGNLYVTDVDNNRIQEWAPGATSGITVAGTGVYGSSPSQLAYPHDVFVDGSGNIYVADATNSRIQEWAPGATAGNTVAGSSVGATGGSAGLLNYPTSVYVDGSGNIYVADQNNNRIQEWAPGATAGTTVAGIGGYGSSATQLEYPTGVYVDGYGDIYVADQYNHRIQEYVETIVKTYTPATGGSYTVSVTAVDGCKAIDTFKIATPPAIKGSTNVCVGSTITLSDSATGGSWSSSNTSIATVSSKGVVTGVSIGTDTIKYVVTLSCGSAVTTIVITVGAIIAPITGSTNICKGATGILNDSMSGGVWSSSNKSIAIISSSGVVTGISTGTDTIKYTKTIGLCPTTTYTAITIIPIPSLSVSGNLCSDSTIMVSSTLGADSIEWESTSDSVLETSVATVETLGITVAGDEIAGSAPNELYYPWGVSVDGSGNVYVVDYYNNRIQKWAPGATSITTVAGTGVGGSAPNQLYYPTGVFVDGSGNIFIADQSNNRIQEWAAGATSGITVAGTGVYGSGPDQLYYPQGVFVDGSGNIYVADMNNNRVQKWMPGATSGTTVAGTGIYGSGPDQLADPTSVFVDGSGNIYVADQYNYRVQEWAPGATSGTTVAGITGIYGSGSSELTYPYGVSVDVNGNIYVADYVNNRIQEWAPGATSGVTVGPTAGYGVGPSSLNYPTGVFVDAGGDIYVSDEYNNRVQEYKDSIIKTFTPGASGSYLVTVTAVNGCKATDTFKVGAAPTVSTITGTTTVCAGGTITLSDSTTGGIWSTDNKGVATVSSKGVMTGIGAGTVNIKYTVTNSCGSAVALVVVTVTGGSAGTITGSTSVCTGTTITLKDTVSGGVWSSGNSSIATVSSTGVVTGISSGKDTIKYSVSGSCASATTFVITVGAPSAASITGSTTLCKGSTDSLKDATSGGSWSSTNTAIASVNTAGVVTGISTGTDTIKYSVTNSCGTTVKTIVVTVSTVPTVASINGTTSLCTGSTVTLSDSTKGGTWSSGNTSIATISSSGAVSGVNAGTDTIKYTVTGSCGSAMKTIAIIVSGAPVVAAITGTTTLCTGGTATLNDSTKGGTWSSVSTSIATVSSAGVVTGIASGNDTIKYSVSNSCGTTVKTAVVTVGTTPTVASITGTTTLCAGSTALLHDSTTSGKWSSTNTSVATINVDGGLAGISAGTDTIKYTVTNSCGTTVKTLVVTVITSPTVGTIMGTTTLCTGTMTTLSDSTSGGTWSSSNSSIATVSSTGVVSGVSTGTDTIKYSVSNSCGTIVKSVVVTVGTTPTVASITGTTTLCTSGTTTLTDSTKGGNWSSSNTSVATVSSAGVVSGVSTGKDTIKYSVTNSCGTAVATIVVTVGSGSTSVGAITGSTTLCVSSTDTLRDTTAGGSWSSGNTSIAIVSTSGVVTGRFAGTDTIKYSVSGGCGTTAKTFVITVGTTLTVAAITGTTTLCTGSTTTLNDSTTGGIWSSSNKSVATVSSTGVVSGMSAGTDTIKYSVSNSCGTAVKTVVVTVGATPTAASITGTTTVCAGSTTLLHDSTSGGKWSSSNTSVATINVDGTVTGVSTGTDTIKYTVTNSCGTVVKTVVITVNTTPTVASITGTTSLCTGSATTLSDSTKGGTWSGSTTSVATVSSAGVVSGVGAGTDTIKYTVSNSCGTASKTVIIKVGTTPTVAAITGTTSLCSGSTTTLNDSTTGGTWSSSNTSVATVSSAGIITGMSAGTDTIKYSVSNSCGTVVKTVVITVNAAPSAGGITGTTTLCTGSTAILNDSTKGGTWSSSNTSIATVSSSGTVNGVSSGTVTIKYTLSNSCGTVVKTLVITVNARPGLASITGTNTLCVGGMTNLSDSSSGGTWSSGSTSIATVSSAGVVTGVSTGTDTIKYSLSNSCGTSVMTLVVTIGTIPSVASITGTTTVCTGSTTILHDSTTGGTWSSSNTSVATINVDGAVTGISTGTDTIKYTVSNSCGATVKTVIVTVNTGPSATAIIGATTLCTGTTTTLTDSSKGGTWSSSTTSVATISSTGVVSGMSVGTDTIKYSVSNSCGTSVKTVIITVGTTIAVGTITSTTTSPLCIGGSLTLTDSTKGGTWSSGNTAIATISSSGVVTGVSAGKDTIKYSVSNSCGTSVATTVVTVSATTLSAGTITGGTLVCIGKLDTLRDTTKGGVWSSSASLIATVSTAGIVSGVSSGTDTIKYTVSNSCGTLVAVYVVTVGTPAGTITGGTTVCTGATDSLVATVSGGTWTSVSTYYATISSTGVVSGLNAGSSVIKYSVTNSCGTTSTSLTVKINTLPYAGVISGTTSICPGATDSLKDASAGGTWASAYSSIASVSSAGVVTGVSAGTDTITYTLSNSCGSAVAKIPITVLPPSAGTITGNAIVCKGMTDTLRDAASGGTWSSSNTSIATVSGGMVAALSAGTDTIKYSLSNSCGSSFTTFVVTVAVPNAGAITGSAAVCAGSMDSLAGTVPGGTWTSVSTYYATISSTGVVTGVNAGSSIIKYTVTTSCGAASATLTVKVNALPYAGAISGGTKVCAGSKDSLINPAAGGAWSSTNTSVATVSSTGMVTAMSAGTDTIKYTVTNTCGSAVAIFAVTVSPAPNAGAITGGTTVAVGALDSLRDAASGGTWSSSNTGIATVSGGIVKGVAAGTDTIRYTVTNSCGTAIASFVVTVSSHGPITQSVTGGSDGNNSDLGQSGISDYTNGLTLTVIPNPAQNVVTVSYEATSEGNTILTLLDVSGVTLKTMDLGIQQSGSVKLPLDNLAAGMYLVELKSGNQRAIQRIIKQ